MQDAAFEEVDAAEALEFLRAPEEFRQAEISHEPPRVQALVLQIVDGNHCAGAAERGLLERGVEQHGHEARGPVMAMDHVRDPARREAGVEAGPAEEGRAFAGVFTGGVDLPGAVEVLMLDEPGFEARRHLERAHAAGRPARIATDADLEGFDERAHQLASGDRAVERRDGADVVTERGQGLA